MNSIWIARDEDEEICIFAEKPVRGDGNWMASDGALLEFSGSDCFPDLRWEDEPIEVIPTVTLGGQSLEDYIKGLQIKLDLIGFSKYVGAVLDDREIASSFEEKED